MKIKNIRIQRFKRVVDVDFDVEGVNVLIGGNNSGKSTVIQAAHFAFTLLQSLNIGNKWPAKDKKSSTVSPTELIYIPSDDPYSLGSDGRLLEDADKSISLGFTFDNGESFDIAIRKGRITNILVEPTNIEFAKTVSQLDNPYSVFSPGLAGVSRNENYVSDGVLLRTLARGDANVVLRNILFRLHNEDRWEAFESDLAQIFPSITVDVKYNQAIDQYINVEILEDARRIPLDLAGTGLLQTLQILAYVHLFAPRLIILDEPDSHLHPNNQRLLCALLSTLSVERDLQILMTTHSRHVLDSMHGNAKILWVQEGSVVAASPEDEVEILLELGALDVREKLATGKFKVVFLTEDSSTHLLRTLLEAASFNMEETAVLSYNGVTSVHLLKSLINQINNVAKVNIVVHRDRDYLSDDEIETWKKEIVAAKAEPFVTSERDVEGYFSSKSYIEELFGEKYDVVEIIRLVVSDEDDDIVASYVNGRIDIEKKRGTFGNLNIGKLSNEAVAKTKEDAFGVMKGKRRLAKLRRVMRETYQIEMPVTSTGSLRDDNLTKLAVKYFPKKK